MNRPITIGKYRIKGVTHNCFFFKDAQYAVAGKAGNRIGVGVEICRVDADSEEQAKKKLEKCLNNKFGESGLWEMGKIRTTIKWLTCEEELEKGPRRLLIVLSIPFFLYRIIPGLLFWLFVRAVLWIIDGFKEETKRKQKPISKKEDSDSTKHIEHT